jgi:hypothetical protein
MGLAFEVSCAALQVGGNVAVREMIAKQVIAVAERGERDANRICATVIREIRLGRSGTCRRAG